jgi:prefoldin subunit 5
MSTQQEMQEQINILQSEVAKLRAEFDLITKLISRYGMADPRIYKHPLEILDRLHTLDGK